MNRGLRMHRNFDLGRGQIKEAAGFNDLKPLIQQSGRINRDAATHDPCRVFESLLYGDPFKLAERQHTEWTTGRRQPDAADFLFRSGAYALVNSIVLGIDG